LEAEFQSIQVQNEERFEMQSNNLQSLEENLVTIAYDVDEIRRRLDKFAMNEKSVFIFFFLQIILVKQV
jgi:L-rhamnose isomerase